MKQTLELLGIVMARQIVLFHFRCPLCGAKTAEVPLEDVGALWAELAFANLKALADEVALRLAELVAGELRWPTVSFRSAVARVAEKHNEVFGPPDGGEQLLVAEHGKRSLSCKRDCPLCSTPAGARVSDNYFTVWEDACKVQTANLLYETDLVLWGALRCMPEWASGPMLVELNNYRICLRGVALNMELMVCPQCGRPVNCLFGEDAENSGYCRHCYDMASGRGGVFVSISLDKNGKAVVKGPGVDTAAPARASEEYMPPETKRGTEF